MRKQEMFARAVNGLRHQKWEQSMVSGEPAYADGEGRRCAWGWVDQGIQPGQHNTYFVEGLAADRVGIACSLDIEQLEFAKQLQWCHDSAETPTMMERRLRRLGERERLLWPA